MVLSYILYKFSFSRSFTLRNVFETHIGSCNNDLFIAVLYPWKICKFHCNIVYISIVLPGVEHVISCIIK